jgi:hypothetical protein
MREFNKDISDFLKEKSKDTGALACEYIQGFSMEEILKTIPSLKISMETTGDIRKGIEKWCEQIGRSLGIIKSIKKY